MRKWEYKDCMFLIDVAEFGWKDINRRAYVRLINGKLTNVKGSRYRLQNLRDALSELRNITKDKFEAGATFNPRTGKTSNVIIGDEDGIDISLLAHGKDTKLFSNDRISIHNHPPDNFIVSLSPQDIYSTNVNKERMGIAIDKFGEYRVSNIKNDYLFGTYDGLDKLEDFLLNALGYTDDSTSTHWLNQELARRGDIKYRWKWHRETKDDVLKYLSDPETKLREKTVKRAFKHFVATRDKDIFNQDPPFFFTLARFIDPKVSVFGGPKSTDLIAHIAQNDKPFADELRKYITPTANGKHDDKIRKLFEDHEYYGYYLYKD